jgi:hypothetical protein
MIDIGTKVEDLAPWDTYSGSPRECALTDLVST